MNFKISGDMCSENEDESEEYRIDLSYKQLDALKLQGFGEEEFERAKEALEKGPELQKLRFYLKYAN